MKLSSILSVDVWCPALTVFYRFTATTSILLLANANSDRSESFNFNEAGEGSREQVLLGAAEGTGTV